MEKYPRETNMQFKPTAKGSCKYSQYALAQILVVDHNSHAA